MTHSTAPRHAGTVRNLGGFATALMAVCLPLAWAEPSMSQPAGDAAPTWKDFEASQPFKDAIGGLKGAAALDDDDRAFLEASVLGQLSQDGNLVELADVRKKIRERVLMIIGNDQAFTQACTLVRDRLAAAARDRQLDPLLRANAMLFIGELTDKARIPWLPAVDTLAAAAQDADLDPAVRIAALTGLANHLGAAARLSSEQSAGLRSTMGRMLPALFAPATDGDATKPASRSPAESWLASRGLSMLPQVTSPAPAETASRLVALIDDATWPIDVRVRAATALGRTVGPDSGVDATAVVTAIEKLAINALEGDQTEAERHREEAAYRGGGGQPGFQPGGRAGPPGAGIAQPGDGVGEGVCRRAAWRLYSLGDAVVPDSKKAGLSALVDKDGDRAQRLASLLKESGGALDAEPRGDVLIAVLDSLDPAGAKKRAARRAGAGADVEESPRPKPDAKPAEPDEPPSSDSPFGQ